MITFGLLYAQQYLPLNPDGKGSLGALGYKDAAGTDHPGADTGVVFNTICSFVTNTNLQHYSGEQHLSYFSQLGGIVWLQFVTPAAGLAVMLAVIRGLRGDKHMGDFYVDLMRILCFVFIPLCVVLALILVANGMPMTFEGAVKATPIDGAAAKMDTQTIARGPVAALVAVKQIGTNGGGFFGPNSTHPFENPTPWSNLIELAEITLLPMASLVMLGLMLKNRAHAAVIYGAMLAFLLVGVAVAIYYEVQPSAATENLPVVQGPNMEGKEVRIGAISGATWAAVTTATSNGSVNCMHDSLNPMAGMVAMSNLMLNVVFSGVGAGFLNMLMYIVVAVFLAGPDGRADARVSGQEDRVQGSEAGDDGDPASSAAHPGRGRPVRGDGHGGQDDGQSRTARLLRDPLRVQLGLCQQRFRFRGAGRQHAGLERGHGYRAPHGPVSSDSAASGAGRMPCRQEARARDHGHAPN